MALLMPLFNLLFILLASAMLYLGLAPSGRQFWWRLCKRMRWLWLSIVLIMSFNTPGLVFADWPWHIAPTHEGVLLGLGQVARLMLMLLLIALMTSSLQRPQLLCAFYYAALPLRWLGMSPEQFAARLSLTIQYIEQHQGKTQANSLLRDFLHIDHADYAQFAQHVRIPLQGLSPFDFVLSGLMLYSLILAWGVW